MGIPVDDRPSTNQLHHFDNKKKKNKKEKNMQYGQQAVAEHAINGSFTTFQVDNIPAQTLESNEADIESQTQRKESNQCNQCDKKYLIIRIDLGDSKDRSTNWCFSNSSG